MTSEKQAQQTLADFADACRRHGIKATHQRTEILRELAGTEEHPDAETVYSNMRKRVPAISLDTVYRTLRLFEEKGLIVRMGAMKGRARFDADTSPHHHFVCTQCGLVRDIYDDTFNRLKATRGIPEMGCVNSVHVELRGLCRTCRSRSEKAGNVKRRRKGEQQRERRWGNV